MHFTLKTLFLPAWALALICWFCALFPHYDPGCRRDVAPPPEVVLVRVLEFTPWVVSLVIMIAVRRIRPR